MKRQVFAMVASVIEVRPFDGMGTKLVRFGSTEVEGVSAHDAQCSRTALEVAFPQETKDREFFERAWEDWGTKAQPLRLPRTRKKLFRLTLEEVEWSGSRVLVGYVVKWRKADGQIDGTYWCETGSSHWTDPGDKARAKVFGTLEEAKRELYDDVHYATLEHNYGKKMLGPVFVQRFRKVAKP